MTIKECIDIVDNIKPNQYTVEDKVMWLSFIDAIIINDVLKTHEGYDGRYDLFEGYSEDKLSVPLIVPSPYDRLYTAYLQMKIDGANGETARYNNSAALYNAYMTEYRKHYNKTHMPLDVTNNRRDFKPTQKAKVGLSDAEYENLKRDLFYLLSEHFSTFVSPDKLYDIVTSYAQNNVELLKGKEGDKGDKGDRGKDGGYYIPSVNQTSDSTVTLRFTPNEASMGEGIGVSLTLPRGATGEKGAEGRSPRINEDGYWEIWGGNSSGWIGTLYKATGFTPYIGENGNWYTWSEESADYVDTGIAAQAEADLENIPVSSLEGVVFDEDENLVSGKYAKEIINDNSGTIKPSTTWVLWNDVIDVPDPTTDNIIYRLRTTGTSSIVLYRQDGSIYQRPSVAAGSKSFTIPSGIYKIRIQEQITNLDDGQTWSWSEVNEFIPYGTKPGYNYEANPMYAKLNGTIDAVDEKIDGKIAELNGTIDAVDEKIDGKIAELNGKIEEEKTQVSQKFELISEPLPTRNLWTYGDVQFVRATNVYLTEPLPAGVYTFSAIVSSTDTDSDECSINLYKGEGTPSVGANTISRGGERTSCTFTVKSEADRIFLTAAKSSALSVGDTATFSNVQLELGTTATDYIEPYTYTAKDVVAREKLDEITGWKHKCAYNFSSHIVKGINHGGYNSANTDGAPINTISAFKLSAKKGFKFVETDVRFTSDNVPVLLHNATIDATSNGTGAIANMTFEEVRGYDFGSWVSEEYAGEQIPSFEEFIVFCRDAGLYPYIELSNNIFDDNGDLIGHYSEEQLDMVVDIVKRYKMERSVTWISFHTETLQSIVARDKGARVGFLREANSSLEGWKEKIQALRTGINEVFVNLSFKEGVSEDDIEIAKTMFLPVETWTVDSVESMQGLDDYISGVTSNSFNFEEVKKEKALG